MSIVKYEYKGKRLGLKDGELVQIDSKPMTLHFSLLHKGHELFEADYGKPFLSSIIDVFGKSTSEEVDMESVSKLIGGSFIKALAAASYIQITENGFKNDETSQMHFKSINGIDDLFSDIDFIHKLIGMAVDSLPENREQRRGKGKSKNKRKKNRHTPTQV